MGSNKYFDCANKILQFIGGNENVASAAHCATRLRLVVKDESLINKEEIENWLNKYTKSLKRKEKKAKSA